MLYGIIDLGYIRPEQAPAFTAQLLIGAVSLLQVRGKGFDKATIAEVTRQILPQARAGGVPLVINDYVDLAAELGADGVHLGQEDGALAEARTVLGPQALIGRSTHSLAQARTAQAEGADYIGFGPLFPTATKPGRPAIGLDDIAAVHAEVTIPIYCIGGVTLENLPTLQAAGVRRVVIVSALLQAANPAAYAQAVRAQLD